MNLTSLLVLLVVAFAGYAISRIGHIYGGHLRTPHHWIYGVLAIIVGAIFFNEVWAPWIIAFGIGHAMSDAKDMLAFQFDLKPDQVRVKKFWGID